MFLKTLCLTAMNRAECGTTLSTNMVFKIAQTHLDAFICLRQLKADFPPAQPIEPCSNP